MNVNLTPELEALVRGKVASGLFGSASEVVRHALRIMVREEEADRRHQDFRSAIAEGLGQANRGELTPAAEVFDRLERQIEERKRTEEEGTD